MDSQPQAGKSEPENEPVSSPGKSGVPENPYRGSPRSQCERMGNPGAAQMIL